MSTLPKLVTVELESPSSTVFQDAGVSPTPHSSFQWKSPPVAKRARASPVTGRLSPVIGAYQSGELIAASGGILPLWATATALPRLTRPQPKWVVHWSIDGARAFAPGSGVPVPVVLPVVTRSAVCSRISRVSSGRSVTEGEA